MYHFMLVAAGGAIGAGCRHLVNLASLRFLGPAFPWGTVAVNVVGCFLMGLLAETIARKFGASQEMRLFLATGILGGFTTFSAFSLDAFLLFERGQGVQAAGYVSGSVILSILALFAGLMLGRALT